MLFPVQQIDTQLSFLNDVLGHFLKRAVRSTRYTKTRLFPTEFLPVHDDNRNTVEAKFRLVFSEIKKLDRSEKAKLLKAYRSQQRIEDICSDKSININYFSELPQSLQTPLKALGKYLYDSVLGFLAFTGLEQINDSLSQHFQRFIHVNGRICCFCGIHEYEEQLANTDVKKQWRAAYDHYFPKAIFPLAAVNFDNLIPICFQCNSKAKSSAQPCLCPNNGQQFAFYPYDDSTHGKLKFTPDITGSTSIIDGDIWTVEPLQTNVSTVDYEKQQSWDRVFKISLRVQERINRFYKKWFESVLDEHPDNIPALKRAFQNKATNLIQQIKHKRDAHHKALVYAKFATMDDDKLEEMINALVSSPASLNQTEGLAKLSERGINFN